MRSDLGKIRRELTKLAKADRLTATDTVAAARDPKNPLHSHFEWNDKVGAQKYRLEQARELISSFEITVKVDRRNVEVQEFVHHPHRPTDGGGYVAALDLKNQPEAARDFVQAQLQVAESYVRKAADFAGVLKVESEAIALADDLRTLRARVSEVTAIV